MIVSTEFSRPVEIPSIGSTKSTKRIEATAEERARLAAALDLVEVSGLSAQFDLHRDSQGEIHLDGRVQAEIAQNCIVSLEPVRQVIDEPIQVRLIETGTGGEARRSGGGAAVDIDPTLEDPPEVFTGPVIDLGGLAVEHLILAIDPYPRAPGAVLPENPAEEGPNSQDSPFAVLAGAVPAKPEKR